MRLELAEDVCARESDIELDVLDETLSFFVRSINIAVSRDWDARVADLPPVRGVGKVTAMLLISRHPGIRPSVIADIAMKDRSEMGRILDGLVADGLIERRPSATDARARALFLTAGGEEMAAKIRGRVRESRDFLGDIDEETYRAVMAPLRALYWRLVENPRPPAEVTP